MTQQEIENIIDRRIREVLTSYNNFTVPQHRHNGVDSLQIPIGNILINPDSGIAFNNGTTTAYNMYIIDQLNGSGLVIEPNTGNFGGQGGTFYIGGGFVSNGSFASIFSQVSNGTDIASSTFLPTVFRWSSLNDFAIQLPDTTRPTAVPGMIAFEAGQFYYCTSAGVWTPF